MSKNLFEFIRKYMWISLFLLVLIVVLVLGVNFQSPKVKDSQIIKNVESTQGKIVVGQQVKTSKIVKVSDLLKDKKNYIEIPKGAEDIEIKNTKSADKQLTIEDRKQFAVLSRQFAKKSDQGLLNQFAVAFSSNVSNIGAGFTNFLESKTITRMFLTSVGDIEKGFINFLTSLVNRGTQRVIDVRDKKVVDVSGAINQKDEYVVVEYYTPAPIAQEIDTTSGKKISITAPESLGYKDVLAYTEIPDLYTNEEIKNVQILWKETNTYIKFDSYDLNNNGKIDYIEWTVPRLTKQTYEIILVSKALRLDSDKNIVEDIYDKVKAQDNNWATVENGQYIKATFEQVLENSKDITIHARPTSAGQSVRIEVSSAESGQIVAVFKNINKEGDYTIYINGLSKPTDTFNLKIIGNNIDIDYIVDPVGWLTGWSYRKKITISNTYVGTNLSDFPLYVKISADADISASAQSFCQDIRFTSSDGTTLLKYQKEAVTAGNCGSIIPVNLWVKVPTILTSANTDIYLYYGKADAPDGQDAVNAWNSNYKGVWHFDNVAPFAASDSTSNVNNGTVTNAVAGTGKIAEAGSFDGSGDYVSAVDSASLDFTTGATVSAWYKMATGDTGGSMVIISKHDISGGSSGYVLVRDLNNKWYFQGSDGSGWPSLNVGSTNTYTDTDWHYIVGTFDGTNGYLYIDGASVGNADTSSSFAVNTRDFHIGNDTYYSNAVFNGLIDEIRVSSIARSAEWLAFEYRNQVGAGNQITFAAQEVPDTTPPTITSVNSNKADGSYKSGVVIDIDVTFSEAVTSTGDVTVTLETGDTDRTCTFSVSSASTGTCNYTVQAGDTTADLTVKTIAGTIADESSNAMTNFVPTTNLAGNKAIVIDTTLPTLSETTAVTTPTSDTTPNYIFNSSEAGTITYGGSCTSATTLATSGANTITFTALTAGTYSNCTITVTDTAENASTALSVTAFTIDTTSPTLSETTAVTTPTSDTTPNYVFNSSEAGTITYGGSCTSATVSAVSGANTITFTALTAGTYSNCTITVTDTAGNASTALSVTTFVVSTIPTVNIPTALEASYTPGVSDTITTSWNANSNSAGTQYYIENTTAGTNSGWITAITWDSTGLNCGVSYLFKVKSRDSTATTESAFTDSLSRTITCPGGGGVPVLSTPPTTVENPSQVTTPTTIVEQITQVPQEIAQTITQAPQAVAEEVKIITEQIGQVSRQITELIAPRKEVQIAMPPIERAVPAVPQFVFQNNWNIITPKLAQNFVLTPLPEELKNLTQKFPVFSETLTKVGVTKMSGLEQLRVAKISLPGLSQAVGLADSIAVNEFTQEEKLKIPTEIIFAKVGNNTIDLNIVVSVSDKGSIQQSVSTISGKQMQLIIRPEGPVNSVKGYLALHSVERKPTASLGSIITEPIETILLLKQFDYADIDGDGVYTATIQTPVSKGEYEITTNIDYKDKKVGVKEIKMITLIDPEGYIYEKTDGRETRINNAVVSLYWLNPDTKKYELWSAKNFQQTNPQVTDKSGSYSFLAPSGFYYIKVESSSYITYQSKAFQVEQGNGVHLNIELKTQYWWAKPLIWEISLIFVAVALLIYNVIYSVNLKKKFLKQITQ